MLESMTKLHKLSLVARKSVLGGLQKKKRSSISAFVVHLLESIISKLATSEISLF